MTINVNNLIRQKEHTIDALSSVFREIDYRQNTKEPVFCQRLWIEEESFQSRTSYVEKIYCAFNLEGTLRVYRRAQNRAEAIEIMQETHNQDLIFKQDNKQRSHNEE